MSDPAAGTRPICKLLPGPWMQRFYTSAEMQISHVEGIEVVRKVLQAFRDQLQDPGGVVTRDTDFFVGP